MRAWVVLLAVSMAGCTRFGPTAEAPCFVHPTTFNADDPTVYLRITMLNVRRYCGVSINADRRPGEANGAITRAPEHGQARVRHSSTGVAVVEYRPAPGFAGADSLRANLGSGGRSVTLDIAVEPPPS